jgi:hypothetical protein
MKTCLSSYSPKEIVRNISRKTQEYMCAYHVFYQQQQAAQVSNSQQQKTVIPLMMMESLVKNFQAHRCKLDFDIGFFKAIIKVEGKRKDE